jgi:hypothetical protein
MAYHTKIPIVNDGLVLYYDAANTKSYPGSGTQINNLVKNSPFQGTLTNGASFDNTNNGGILLDGSNQDIELTNPLSFQYGNEITVIVGFTPNGLSRGALFAPTGNDTDQMMRFRGDVNPPYVDLVTTSAGGNFNVLTNISTTEVMTGTSYFAGGVVDGTTTRLYINGKKESELTSGVARALWDATLPIGPHQGGKVNIGSRPFTPSDSDFLEGIIHYVLLYNRVLSDAEMLQNYNSLRGRFISWQ